MTREYDISENMQVFAEEVVQVLGEAGLQLTYHPPHDPGCSSGYTSKGRPFEDARKTYLSEKLPLLAEQGLSDYAALHYVDVSLHVPVTACGIGILCAIEAKSGRILSGETAASGRVELQNVTTVHELGRYVSSQVTYKTGVRYDVYSFNDFEDAKEGTGRSSERHAEESMNLPSSRAWAEKTQAMLTFLRSILSEQQALGELRLTELE